MSQSAMSPAVGRPHRWQVPAIVTLDQLCFRLQIPANHLDWFVDHAGRERLASYEKLCHYRYRWLAKRTAGRSRLIESPKPRLKAIQRQILFEILSEIPVHPAAHGFVNSRSITTFVTPHLGKHHVLRMDLQDFFPSVRKSQVRAIFQTAGYPEPLCRALTGLCTNWTPASVWEDFPAFGTLADRWLHQALYERPHLPQGSPTSPMLANLCGFTLDCRLSGLARSAGVGYTRYADDLLFSGERDFQRSILSFQDTVCQIVQEEGFEVNFGKIKSMSKSQSQTAVGLVLNQHANISRRAYDELKATLHNFVKLGPSSQNRQSHQNFRSHLQGRVAHVPMVTPIRG